MYIENTQDWQLITEEKEPEYTILQFERLKSVGTYDRWWTLRDNGHYSASGDGVCTLNIMMNIGCSVKDGSFVIHQVRRESDKSIWTVRDKYVSSQAPLLGIRTIEKFVIDDESIGIRAVEAISADPITTSLKYLTVPVPVEPTEQIAKVGEYVIHKDATKLYPNEAVKVDSVSNCSYEYTYPKGYGGKMNISECRIATQQEIDRDWKKPVEEKVEPLIQVLLTRKQINKLIEILK